MSLSLKRRGRHWYAVGQVEGQRIKESLKTSDRTVAEALKRDLELRLLAGGRLSRLMWKDYREEFLRWIAPQVKAGPRSTFAKYNFVLSRFSRFLEDRAVVELGHVQPATIAEYAEARRQDVHPNRKNKVGPEGIKSDMRILHRVFSYAEECGYVADNPVRFKKLGTAAGKTLPFSENEVALILTDDTTARSPQLRAVVLTFLFTGLRISDVTHLPTAALDFKNNRIVMQTQKRGKIVVVALHSELRAALDVHLAYRNKAQQAAEFVFTTNTGHVMLNMDATLRRIFRRCKIERGHPHRFRDTFAVRLLAQGASLYDVAKLLGINMSTAERHYAPYVQELQDRGSRLVAALKVPIAPDPEKVVQFWSTLGPALADFGEPKAKGGGSK